MMMPSASSIDRVEQCPASHVLPRVEETSDAAERGTEIHEFLRLVVTSPEHREQYLGLVPLAWRNTCVNLDLNALLEDPVA